MWIAYINSNYSAMPNLARIFISVGQTQAAATTAMPEVLESHGFSNAQIGRMLDRMKVRKMTKRTHGWTDIMYPEGPKA
jgi:hypothetical protein